MIAVIVRVPPVDKIEGVILVGGEGSLDINHMLKYRGVPVEVG